MAAKRKAVEVALLRAAEEEDLKLLRALAEQRSKEERERAADQARKEETERLAAAAAAEAEAEAESAVPLRRRLQSPSNGCLVSLGSAWRYRPSLSASRSSSDVSL